MHRPTAGRTYLLFFRQPVFNPLDWNVFRYRLPTWFLALVAINGLADFFLERAVFGNRFSFIKQIALLPDFR
jgi:hypothetical protein